MAHFSLRILLCARCRTGFLPLGKGLTVRDLVPRWLCQKAGGKEALMRVLTRCQKSLLQEVRPRVGLKRDESAQGGGIKTRGRIQAAIPLSLREIWSCHHSGDIPSVPGAAARAAAARGRWKDADFGAGPEPSPGWSYPGKELFLLFPLRLNHKSAPWEQGWNGAHAASLLSAGFLSYQIFSLQLSQVCGVFFCSSSLSPVESPGNNLVSISRIPEIRPWTETKWTHRGDNFKIVFCVFCAGWEVTFSVLSPWIYFKEETCGFLVPKGDRERFP